MNKQEALQKLTALEAETKALRAIIEAPDTPTVAKRWRPLSGETYSHVIFNGKARTFCKFDITEEEYAHGNCFKTEAQAEIAAKAVGVTLKICAAAFAVDPDAGGYDHNERRRSLYLHSNGSFDENSYSYDLGKPIYVHTREQAEQMAAILNAEKV